MCACLKKSWLRPSTCCYMHVQNDERILYVTCRCQALFFPSLFKRAKKNPKKYHEGGWQSIVAYLKVGAKFREVCRFDLFHISVCVNRSISYSHFDKGLFLFWNLKIVKILAIVMGFTNADRLNPWVLFLSVIHFVEEKIELSIQSLQCEKRLL